MKRIILLFLIIGFATSSCERDDICAETTPTTPLLVIRFYDAENPTEFKAVTNLGIIEDGPGATTGILFNTDSIAIPLRTDGDETRFRFILNSDNTDENPANDDVIIFNYTRTEEYVSKACGFKVFYNSLQEQRIAGDDGFWIDDLLIINPTIEDETSAHIRILH